MAAQRVVGEPAQVVVPAGPGRRVLVFGAELLDADREVRVEHAGDGVLPDVAGDELSVGGIEYCRVEPSRAADGAGPGQLSRPDVLPQRAAEQLGVPAGPQAFHWPERRGLGEDGRGPGKRLVFADLPGHLLTRHPQHERAQVTVPAERIVEPAVGIQDLQQVLLGGLTPVELGPVAQRDPGRVRQRPRRVLAVRTV